MRPRCEIRHGHGVTDILDNSAGEFEDTEEVYEAVGEVLQGISEKSEDDIRYNPFIHSHKKSNLELIWTLLKNWSDHQLIIIMAYHYYTYAK